jgi:DNA-binding transcriptional regulator YiaG
MLSTGEIISVRKCLQLTQKQFAQMIGVNNLTICRWENGRFFPSRLAENKVREIAERELGRDFLSPEEAHV